MSRVRFPYLSVFIALYTPPFFGGIYLLIMASSLAETAEAVLSILVGAPAVVSAVALWRGNAWALKPLVLFFVLGFVAAVYFNIQDKTPYSTLAALAVFYWLVAWFIVRYVYRKQKNL